MAATRMDALAAPRFPALCSTLAVVVVALAFVACATSAPAVGKSSVPAVSAQKAPPLAPTPEPAPEPATLTAPEAATAPEALTPPPLLADNERPTGDWREIPLNSDFAGEVRAAVVKKLALDAVAAETLRVRAIYSQVAAGTNVRAYVALPSASGWTLLTVSLWKSLKGEWS